MTRSLRWSPILECGLPFTQEDHQRIVSSIAAVATAFADRRSDAVGQALHALLRETERHFSQQEQAMRETCVARHEFAAHKAEHDEFLAQLRFFHQRFETCNAGLHGDVMEFVSAWFLPHILGQDRKVSPQLLAQAA